MGTADVLMGILGALILCNDPSSSVCSGLYNQAARPLPQIEQKRPLLKIKRCKWPCERSA